MLKPFTRITNMYGYDVCIGRNLCTVTDEFGNQVWTTQVQIVHAGTNVDAFKQPRYGLPKKYVTIHRDAGQPD